MPIYTTNRRLLYHRGVDDQAATYVTDYMEAALCFVLATYLLVAKRRYDRFYARHGHSHAECRRRFLSSKSTHAVVVIKYSLMCTSLLGGLTHQFLQQVSGPRSAVGGCELVRSGKDIKKLPLLLLKF